MINPKLLQTSVNTELIEETHASFPYFANMIPRSTHVKVGYK